MLLRLARKYIPGGVNSPVRSFKAVDENPLFVKTSRGSKIWTEDGRKLVDFVMSWGALILGHSHPVVRKAILQAVKDGTSWGLCHRWEVEFAQILCKAGKLDMVRVVNSGTEACMSAVRLARGYTGKKYIIKFEGCYHGHADQFLTKGGSGLATLSIPASEGVPQEFTSLTITLPYNSPRDVLEEVFRKYDVAGVIVEPVAGNMGVVKAKRQFLRDLRELCTKYGAVLIWDEVITGFRVGWGGYQKTDDIKPDLVTFGKVIGGGLPVGAFGGKREIMEKLAPDGPVYQAGTLAGNPLALRCGIAVLNLIRSDRKFYRNLLSKTKRLADLISDTLSQKGIAHSVVWETGVLSVFFTEKEPENFEDVQKSDKELFKRVFKKLYEYGVLIPPSPYEAWFLSSAHSDADIEKVVKALKKL